METKMTEIEIRPAVEADAALVLRFIKEIAEYERLGHEVSATEETIRQSLFGSCPAAWVLLAFYKNEPAGFAVYFFNYSTFLGKPGLYLEDIFVRPGLRGHGIGRTLFLEIVSIARQKKCERLDFAVLDWNQSAHQFYEKLGARPMTDWVLFRMDRKAIEGAGDKEKPIASKELSS